MGGPRSAPAVVPAPRKKGAPGSDPKPSQSALLSNVLAPLREFQTGRNLGQGYRISEHISAGADGDVYAATDADGLRSVAVKRVRVCNAKIQQHVQQELAAVFHAKARHAEEVRDPESIGHPFIVAYLDWFAGPSGLDREVCIVMSRCEFNIKDMVYYAHSLRSQYERQASSSGHPGSASRRAGLDPTLYRFTEREVAKALREMLSALAFLNRHGVIHRDVKGDNVLWAPGGLEGCYKLADFGTAACLAEGEAPKKNEDCGTLWIMAPELLGRRGHGPNCDVWSLGVMLFEMASLAKPFNSKELLLYRASPGAWIAGSFWPAMCGAGTPRGTPVATPSGQAPPQPSGTAVAPGTAKRRGNSTSALQSTRTPPHGVTSSKGQFPKAAKRPERTSSVSSLPTVGAGRQPAKPSSSPAGVKPISPLQSDARKQGLGTEDSGGAHSQDLRRLLMPPPIAVVSGSMSDAVHSPASPSSSKSLWSSRSPDNPLGAKKAAFLRKRCAFRWCYTDDLRSVVFDDMLEEDVTLRPAAANLLEAEAVQRLLGSYDWGPDVPAPPGPAAAPPGGAAAPGPDAQPPSPAAQRAHIVECLKHMTGENFFEAVRQGILQCDE